VNVVMQENLAGVRVVKAFAAPRTRSAALARPTTT